MKKSTQIDRTPIKRKNPTLVKLSDAFYDRQDVVSIARELLGKVLVTRFDGVFTSGRIVETEAYAGVVDRASHAFGGRRTARTEVMFKKPGTSYVYLCYGLHHMFNVVTNKEEIPHAILIRALEPMEGVEAMLRRTGKLTLDNSLTRGPGNLSKAMGISTMHSGNSLNSDEIFIADDGFVLSKKNLLITPRIGVDYAKEDAKLPYRFAIRDNSFVSGAKSKASK